LLNLIGAKLILVAEGKSFIYFLPNAFQVIFNRLACHFKVKTFQSFFFFVDNQETLVLLSHHLFS